MMGTIVQLDVTMRSAARATLQRERRETAEIILFPGIRYERRLDTTRGHGERDNGDHKPRDMIEL